MGALFAVLDAVVGVEVGFAAFDFHFDARVVRRGGAQFVVVGGAVEFDVARGEVDGVALVLRTEAGVGVHHDALGFDGVHLVLRLFVVGDVVAHDAQAVFLPRVRHKAEHRHFAVARVAGMDALAAAVFVVVKVEAVGLYRAVEVAAALAVEQALLVAEVADAGLYL